MKAIWNRIKDDGSLNGDARMNQRSFKQAQQQQPKQREARVSSGKTFTDDN